MFLDLRLLLKPPGDTLGYLVRSAMNLKTAADWSISLFDQHLGIITETITRTQDQCKLAVYIGNN